MKEVVAIIRRQRAKAAKDALANLGFFSLHAIEVEGRGKQRGLKYSSHENGDSKEVLEPLRGSEAGMRYLPKKMLSLVVRDEEVARVVHAIVKSSRTGEIGDGKIFVLPIDEVTRVRTGETGSAAV